MVAVVKRNGILTMKRSQENSSSGLWAFPGGKIEPGEEPGEAAVRELEEEASITGKAEEIGSPYLNEGELGIWQVYPVKIDAEPGEVELDWEHSDYRWVKKEELEEMETLGSLKALKRLDI